ncbi:MAG: hypothetical protein Q8Q48_00970 [Candidatus Staskawiczbacteria bacterium]|nr:hypothetical protein [Candidatus Staskawiczbacteria bacterium]
MKTLVSVVFALLFVVIQQAKGDENLDVFPEETFKTTQSARAWIHRHLREDLFSVPGLQKAEASRNIRLASVTSSVLSKEQLVSEISYYKLLRTRAYLQVLMQKLSAPQGRPLQPPPPGVNGQQPVAPVAPVDPQLKNITEKVMELNRQIGLLGSVLGKSDRAMVLASIIWHSLPGWYAKNCPKVAVANDGIGAYPQYIPVPVNIQHKEQAIFFSPVVNGQYRSYNAVNSRGVEQGRHGVPPVLQQQPVPQQPVPVAKAPSQRPQRPPARGRR